ncbi:MAG: hypothetical protein KW788_03775 [Candidatus Doudnabacteria bacterium]|nr:hypothetical protein [Candidatus Doudnabacteria bacterium]
MQTICQLAFNLMTTEESRNAEAIVREYLLRVSEQVHMSRSGSSYLSLFHFPHPIKNRQFESLLKEGDVASIDNKHETFNLTENIKELLNHATLFLNGPRSIFYGLTDPKFFKAGQEIASMISNEKILTLHIPDTDKAEMANKGVYMDSPEL